MEPTYNIEGEYEKREDVVIEVTKTVEVKPQTETRTWTVAVLEKHLAEIETDIEHLTNEKASLEKILTDNKVDIDAAVKPAPVE